MSAEQVGRGDRPVIGFHTFADDTPRDVEPPASQPLTAESTPPAGWADAVDREDFGPMIADWQDARRAVRGGGSLLAALLVIGVVGGSAVAVGLGVTHKARNDSQAGLSQPAGEVKIRVAPEPPLAMPALAEPQPVPQTSSPLMVQTRPDSPAAVSPGGAPKVVAELDRRAPVIALDSTAANSSSPPAQVLADNRPAAAPGGNLGSVTSAPAVPDNPAVDSDASRPQIALGPQAPNLAPAAPSPASEERCRFSRTRAEFLVCTDPELAAADQRVMRAYRAAIAAGAPERRLAREQRDWLAAREDASRRSRRDVMNLYALRLDDLTQWLDDDEPVGPPVRDAPRLP